MVKKPPPLNEEEILREEGKNKKSTFGNPVLLIQDIIFLMHRKIQLVLSLGRVLLVD